MFNNINMMMNQKYDLQRKHTTANGRYFISTNDTIDNGWETMVFSRNSNTGDVDYTGLETVRYDTKEEAYGGHDLMIAKWEAK